MDLSGLSDRKKKILKSIVDAYIDSGEPVGSKYLTTYGNISLSPATVRNEMSELEELGFLDKPHTSAGRVPSSLGYKFYVDSLGEDYRLSVEELELLGELTRFKTAELDRILERAGKIMSGVTKYAAVSLTRHSEAGSVKRYDTVYIDEHSFLLVLILSDGETKTARIGTEAPLSEAELLSVKLSLNAQIANLPPDKIPLDTVVKLEEAFGKHRALAGKILRCAYSLTHAEKGDDVKIDGVTNLLSYPEFNSVEKARSIMELAETRSDAIRAMMDNSPESGFESVLCDEESGLKIYIGDTASKDPSDALGDTSLVYCSVPMGGTKATIGILGPRRMDYRKVVASLKFLAKGLADAEGFEEKAGSGLPKP